MTNKHDKGKHTMKYEVKNRYSGKVQFIAKIKCDKDILNSIKLGLAMKWDVKNDADLAYADAGHADRRTRL